MPEHTPSPTPSRAVYGFAMYLSFKLFFILYVIWAYVPESWFEFIGITYLPNRYWALSIPVFLLTVLTTFAFVIYPSLGLLMTPDINELRTVKDSKSKSYPVNRDTFVDHSSKMCCCTDLKKCKKIDFDKMHNTFAEKSVPALYDLDVGAVSEHLYLK